jgi:TonB-linked SusC/RagA family outer membrane protein
VVKRKDEIPVEKPTVPLPPHDIIGRVTNAAGQPLDGATVIIKRKQSGVLTNANGLFRLAEVYPTDTLYVSYIGYARAIVRVGSETNLKIVLKEATNSLDQVVVQAYGETSQRTATGNIGTVTAAQIAKEPVMNVLNVLQGQIPGVLVTNTSGYSSGTINVQIRGRNTVGNFPADPLYVIDGVPLTILEVAGQYGYNSGSMGTIQSGIQSPAVGQSPFFNINPGDIESISVLKDADATAIYGSRGANGVILITTKKGKAGKTHVEVNGYDGISEDNRYYQLLTTSQYIEMRKEALANDGLPININTAPDLVAWSPNSDTNWQKVLFGGFGKTADASVSLSGGDSNNTFRISTTYHNQTDILTYSGANQRGSFSFNFNHKSTDQRFNLALTTNYTLTSVNTIEVPLAISLPPNAPPIFNSQGNLNYAGWAPLNYAFPFSSLLNPYTAATNLLNSNLVLSYELTKGLILKTSLGYNNIESSQTQVTTIASQDPSTDPTGSSSIGNTLIHNLIVEPDIEYNRYINKGKFDVLLGATAQENTTIGSNSNGYGYTNDALLTAIGAAPTQSANNYKALYGYEGVFGRINYNWENKYIIDLNGRRDGSTKFAPGLQFGNFGSVGTAWIFSEENWIKQNIQSLSFGKIRASYGTTGGTR